MKMADSIDEYLCYSVENLETLTVNHLKRVLKKVSEHVTGKKASLVSRLYAYICRVNAHKQDVSKNLDINQGLTVDINIPEQCTFDDLIVLADEAVWTNDLRLLPNVNFHQLYQYLVERTRKYGDQIMKGTVFKKERAYSFYKERHICDIKVAVNKNLTLVRAKVIASMKKMKYKVVVVLKNNGDVMYAACDCPAGLGPRGEGKCNHAGGLLFCVEDFARNDMQKAPEVVTCTSRLSNWNVPRDLKMDSAPLAELKIRKVAQGKHHDQSPISTNNDPRAPADRCMDFAALGTLYTDLENCMPASGFFLFHEDLTETNTGSEEVEVLLDESFHVADQVEVNTSINEVRRNIDKSSDLSDINVFKLCTVNMQDINYSGNHCEIQSAVSLYIDKDHVDPEIINLLEGRTKAQSDSDLWNNVRKCKLTASNFGKIIKRKKNPDGLLKQMLYSNFTSKATEYGSQNEEIAVKEYVNKMATSGTNVVVTKMGLLLHKQYTWLGASVDGTVHDTTLDSFGCLEVKCPMSRGGLSVNEAVEKQPFCLKKTDSGEVQLSRNHDYYFQVQGQMFVTGLSWTDFVVWLGNGVVFIERIQFDQASWDSRWLPALQNFYKTVFVPEMLTRRVHDLVNN